jgi:hypothetical protein
MFLQNPGERDGRIYTRPVALPLAEHGEPHSSPSKRLAPQSVITVLAGCAGKPDRQMVP